MPSPGLRPRPDSKVYIRFVRRRTPRGAGKTVGSRSIRARFAGGRINPRDVDLLYYMHQHLLPRRHCMRVWYGWVSGGSIAADPSNSKGEIRPVSVAL
jgi:hypothetical protein